ncbi:Trypanosome basal body component protein [Trypanosoma cruzi]|uniref:Trypanosome basal body component protein n=1 Tax=Trypanosoma cruzi TaxID=5693 RepID=A0A2V2VAB8_TRYCR|nr:Trypanosome basal body component protein [Trypanosoma cruzi]
MLKCTEKSDREAMGHVDQLLEEYLRVINSKDDEIHELIRGLEERRCELRKKEDTYKMDVVSARQKLERAQKRVKKMAEKVQKGDEHIEQLVKHNDAMKVQADEMRRKLNEATEMLEANRERHCRELRSCDDNTLRKFGLFKRGKLICGSSRRPRRGQ